MDLQEVIEIMRRKTTIPLNGESFDKISYAFDLAVEALEEIQQYRAIGTAEECREAMERQMAKKPSYNASGCDKYGNDIWDEWLCPNCEARYEVVYDDYDYCPYCGQAILWENGDEH